MIALVWVVAETFSLLPPHVKTDPNQKPNFEHKTGIIHVHSIFSHDGGGSIQKIAEAASEAGADFVVVTDHDSSRARREGYEKRFGNVDVFVEMEASVQAGHLLVFYSHTAARELEDEAVVQLAWKHYLGQDTKDGFFVAVAHPSNIKNPWTSLDRYPDGIEVVNFDSQWQRQLSESFPDFALTFLLSSFNPYLTALRLFRIYPKDFVVWDNMNALSRGHFAILSQDSHEKLKINSRHSLAWPSYAETFKLASNVVFFSQPLPEDFEGRKKMIYQSLRQGRNALVFHAIAPFQGNDWRLVCGEKIYRAGEEVPYSASCEFQIDTPSQLPYPKVIRLWKDGNPIDESKTPDSSVHFALKGPGIYRLQVSVTPHTATSIFLSGETPYVFYNPIYLR